MTDDRAISEAEERRLRNEHSGHPQCATCRLLAQLEIERAAHRLDVLALKAQIAGTRAAFYESVMRYAGPHQRESRRCRIAEASGALCCNPACNGTWGTGCWCCHGLLFAADAEPKAIEGHFRLVAKFEELKKAKAR